MDQKATILECQSLAPCGAAAHLIRKSGRWQSAGGPRRATLPGQRLHPGAAEHRRSLRVETSSRKGLTGFPFKESTLFSSCHGEFFGDCPLQQVSQEGVPKMSNRSGVLLSHGQWGRTVLDGMIACCPPTDSDKQMADQTGILAGSLHRSQVTCIPSSASKRRDGRPRHS